MPPLPAVPKMIRVELEFENAASQTFSSRFFVGYTGGPPTAADLSTFSGDVGAAWSTHINSGMSNEVTLAVVRATDLDTLSGAQGEDAVAIVGANSSPIPTMGTATVVDFQINRRYRGGKPRVYLPVGVQNDLQTPETWTSAYVTFLTGAWSSFIAEILALTPSSFTPTDNYNVSFYESFTAVTNPITGRTKDVPKLRVGGPVTDPIVNHSVRPILGSQRRRLKLKS